MGLNALFLGYGRMGAALGEAWLGAGLVDGIDAVDPIRAQDVQARLYRQAADLPDTPYDLVVMAVKPVMAREALSALPASQLQNATIISVCRFRRCALRCRWNAPWCAACPTRP